MQENNLPKRQYTEEFKTEAVRLSESVEGHEAARRLGVPVATLGNWKRRRAAAGTTGAVAPEVASSAAALLTRRPVSD
jgi:transposase